MKRKPTLIIFTGLPGTGKTFLSKKAAEGLGLPLVAKDAVKEIMFDELGWSDKEWSAKLALATFRIMDYVIEQQLRVGNALILESNFMPRLANKKFQDWQTKYECNIIQVVCRTDVDVLARRYHARSFADRHPGHLDKGAVEDHREAFVKRVENGEDQPLELKGKIIVVDTTNFTTVGVANVVKQLQRELA